MPIVRRRPGIVRDAIFAAFERRREPMRLDAVYAAVRSQLGEDVPHSSIRSYLRLNSSGNDAPFHHDGHGRYSLRRLRTGKQA